MLIYIKSTQFGWGQSSNIHLYRCDRYRRVSSSGQLAVSSAECPHLQLHDAEIVGFREAAVVEGVARTAAAQIQVLIDPQPEVTTRGRERDAQRLGEQQDQSN